MIDLKDGKKTGLNWAFKGEKRRNDCHYLAGLGAGLPLKPLKNTGHSTAKMVQNC